MNTGEAVVLFKCLADKSRLEILRSLSIEDMYVERLAERLGLTPATISFHLKKLAEVGAVRSYKSQYYTMYSLRPEVFGIKLTDIINEPSDEADEQAEREEKYRRKVLESFFSYGRLVSIPAQRKKKRIILEEILKAFEPDKIYPEREVNLIISEYHDDFCTLRRDMISEGLMTRNGGMYKRI